MDFAISLNYSEQQIAKRIARERDWNNKSNNIANQKQSSRTDYDINLEGIAGEIACAKFFGVRYDDVTDSLQRPKEDLWVGNVSVDVKTALWEKDTKFKGRWSTRITKRVNDVQRYVFVKGCFPNYWICGWLFSYQHIDTANIDDVGYGKFYKALEENIYDMRTWQ